LGYFKKIKLTNYRNFKKYECEFSKKSNVLFGKNGSGKTNILESISLFGKGTGLRKDSIVNLIKKDENQFINFGNYFDNNNFNEIKILSDKKNDRHIKKIYLNNNNDMNSINYIKSIFSFLFFVPDMERLFTSSPNMRRNFFDNLIFSSDNNYNTLLNKYKKNISERSKILNLQSYDKVWLEKIESNIAKLGIEIYNNRNKQIDILHVHLRELNNKKKLPFFPKISHNDHLVNSDLTFEKYLSELKNSRTLDQLIGGAKYGPHKSDFEINIKNNFNASQLSTGQQKTIILSFLFAQCNYLVNECKIFPILLMDEVCSYLDENNRDVLLELTNYFDLQIFFTGTNKNLFSFLSTNANFYNITE